MTNVVNELIELIELIKNFKFEKNKKDCPMNNELIDESNKNDVFRMCIDEMDAGFEIEFGKVRIGRYYRFRGCC